MGGLFGIVTALEPRINIIPISFCGAITFLASKYPREEEEGEEGEGEGNAVNYGETGPR